MSTKNTISDYKQLKVMTIVGTRPEIIRLSRIIVKLDKYFDHTLVHTGQNFDFELNEIFFNELEIRKPDLFLDCAMENAASTIAKVIHESDRVFAQIKPDAILILGDTNSALSAIPAKRRKIPIFHMEAGNRCFDMNVPEEINRKIVDHIADINLPYSSIAREYLLSEGIAPDTIIKTGSPLREVIEYFGEKIKSSNILRKLGLKKKGYFLVSVHREENVDGDNFKTFLTLLDNLSAYYQIPVIVTTHPRTRKKLDSCKFRFNKHIRFEKPFGFLDYVHLQKEARVVLSDSGTITEEASILQIKALNLRNVHERPEGMEEGAVILSGLDFVNVQRGINILEQFESTEMIGVVDDYISNNVSEKIPRIILSYTHFVDRKIWRKKE